MAKLERKNIKIFASKPNDATQVTSFLTAKDETPNVSLDPDVIQNSPIKIVKNDAMSRAEFFNDRQKRYEKTKSAK